MELLTTKDKILFASVRLFSDSSYDKVSMRDIAGKVGIKAASIYNHFQSKRDILKNLYEYYALQQSLVAPTLESLLRMAETKPLKKILMKLNYRYTPELLDVMERILIIASQRIRTDPDSENFIRKVLFESTVMLMLPLLNRLIELGKIEPVDTEVFNYLLMYYTYSSAVLNLSAMKITYKQWRRGLNMIFSLLKPIPG